MAFTSEQIQSLYSPNSNDPVFYLISFPEYPSQDLRFVNNNANIVSSINEPSQIFYASNFNVVLGKRESETINSATISISNIDRVISDLIQTLDAKVKILVQVILLSDPDVSIMGDTTYYLQNVHFNATTISGDLMDDMHLQDVASTIFQTSSVFPGIF